MRKNTGLAVLFLLGCAFLAWGQDDEQVIKVQSNFEVVRGPVLHLKGAVKLNFGRQFIHADEVDFDVTTGDIEARGTVRVLGKGFGLGRFQIGPAPPSSSVCVKFVSTSGFEPCLE